MASATRFLALQRPAHSEADPARRIYVAFVTVAPPSLQTKPQRPECLCHTELCPVQAYHAPSFQWALIWLEVPLLIYMTTRMCQIKLADAKLLAWRCSHLLLQRHYRFGAHGLPKFVMMSPEFV